MAMDINAVLAQWESFGVFSVFLPFLLVFAIVYGIVSSLNLFGKNKGVSVIIAVILGLLSIRLPLFNEFITEAFPRFGVGLAILLIILILIGMFIPETDNRLWGRVLMGVGAVIAITVFVKSSSTLGWISGASTDNFIPWIILAVLLVGVIIAVAAAQGTKPATTDDKSPMWIQRASQ